MRIAAAAEDADLPFDLVELLGYPTTDFGWPVVPDALREWLIMFRARFRAALPPIFITESGASYGMGPDENGVVDDQPRIDYLDGHLRAVAEAVQRGVDVRGYYVWSLMDNFEWAEGYTQRFGLVHVDFETQVRTPKRSFDWYAELIAAQTRSTG
jgi:beta-glucosidase